MGRFRQLQENPQFRLSPLLPSVTVQWGENQLSLSIDGRERVDQLTYQIEQNHPPEVALYEALAHLVHSRPLHSVQAIGWREFDQFFAGDPDYRAYRDLPSRALLTVPLQLFYQAVAEYQGRASVPPKSSFLICRCFAVFEREIVSYIERHPESDLKALTGELLAGGGCTRCSGDLRGLLARYGKAPVPPPSRAQLVVDIYQMFCHWRRDQEMELDILDLHLNTLTVTPLGTTTPEDVEAFERHLKERPPPSLNHLKILLKS